MSEEEKPPLELETKFTQTFRINESEEDEQREIEVSLDK